MEVMEKLLPPKFKMFSLPTFSGKEEGRVWKRTKKRQRVDKINGDYKREGSIKEGAEGRKRERERKKGNDGCRGEHSGDKELRKRWRLQKTRRRIHMRDMVRKGERSGHVFSI